MDVKYLIFDKIKYMKHNDKYSNNFNNMSRYNYRSANTRYSSNNSRSYKNPKKRHFGLKIFLIIICCAAVISACCFFYLTSCSNTLASGKTVEVTIDEGSSTWQIANKLSESGVVENKFAFMFAVTEMGVESSLKSGTYTFEGGKSVKDYVNMLISGAQSTGPQLLIVEGMTISDISKVVENISKGRITSSDFIAETKNVSKYVNKYNFLQASELNSLEGFLFPKTYSLSSKDTSESIINMMLSQFEEETKNLDLTYASSKNLNLYDVVTLASIIEKESTEEYFSKVSSVFYNRLDVHMHLDSDATTAYEVGHVPSSQEIHSNTPYSTYTNYGLPPTPICSPGLKCLQAACNPENTDYLFFACNKDSNGQMKFIFSINFKDHQQALIDLGIV